MRKSCAGKVSNDPSAVIASGEIDAVIIGSPTATHIPLLRECIAAGVHALCEKPIDLDVCREGLQEDLGQHIEQKHAPDR